MTEWGNLHYRLHHLRLALQGIHLPVWFSTWSWGTRLSVGALVLCLYYFGGALWVNRVDTNPVFTGPVGSIGPHYSRAIYAASQLTLREVDQHHWTPADPFFLPGSILTTMPRFQQGLVAAVGRFSESLAGLDAGADGSLSQAAGLFKYPGTVWRLASGISWLPTAPSSRQYRRAAHALEDYDDAMAKNDQPSILQQAGGIATVLDGFGGDLDSLADRLSRHLDGNPSALFDGEGRALFQSTRGHLYAWGIILTELGKDDQDMITERGMTSQWRHMVDIVLKASAMDPALVTSGDGMLANHLAEQGFALLRARALAGEIKAGFNNPN